MRRSLIESVGVCTLTSLAVTPGYACLLGVSGWAFLTGFVVNAGGQLTFAAPDLEHLVLLLVASVAASAWRERRGEHHRDRRDAQRSRV